VDGRSIARQPTGASARATHPSNPPPPSAHRSVSIAIDFGEQPEPGRARTFGLVPDVHPTETPCVFPDLGGAVSRTEARKGMVGGPAALAAVGVLIDLVPGCKVWSVFDRHACNAGRGSGQTAMNGPAGSGRGYIGGANCPVCPGRGRADQIRRVCAGPGRHPWPEADVHAHARTIDDELGVATDRSGAGASTKGRAEIVARACAARRVPRDDPGGPSLADAVRQAIRDRLTTRAFRRTLEGAVRTVVGSIPNGNRDRVVVSDGHKGAAGVPPPVRGEWTPAGP